MPLELTPDVQLREDVDGRVRQLSHPHQQYRPAPVDVVTEGLPRELTPRTLAEQYLRETADTFGFASEETSDFSATTGVGPTEAGVELRFTEGARGWVFAVDPATDTGMLHSAATPVDVLAASAASDGSTVESVVTGPIPNSRLVPLDNNTAQRTF